MNPFIGTGGHGHTFPGATMPFGMVQLSPDTRPDPGDWDGCGGYHFSDSVIYGFSHTHLSGTGVSDYCDVLLQPVSSDTSFERADFVSPFLKNRERAEPGFYEVFLEKPLVKVELTASERIGFHRYNFYPKMRDGQILLDLKWRDLVLDADMDLSRMDEGIITGHRFSRSWATDQRLFFFLKFSKKPSGVRSNGREQAIFEFKWTGNGNHAVVVECAISSVDVAGAEANWKAETTNFDFEKAKTRAQSAWQKQLSKIEIEGGSDRDRTVFYTALYHTMIAPNIFSDVDGRYRGRDQQIHQAQKGATMYTVFSLWDTYRALHPLMTILEPERVRDWMYTFWRQSEEGGKLPVWELAANETNCMIGNHSIPVIADAYLKGLVPDSLVEPLYEAMKKAATDGTRGLDLYDKLGYIPSDLEPESVSKTIEYSFDDYSIGLMAEKMGRWKDWARFSGRASTVCNLYEPESGFFRPKMNATFVEPFDPAEVNFNFTEGNAWQYRFLHQGEFFESKNRLEARLDSFFFSKKPLTGRVQADLTGLVGQYAQGNEPNQHVPFWYMSIHKNWKTIKLVSGILDSMYTDKPDGLPGNDDCGQMSAWAVFTMLGLYPTDPVSGSYDRFDPVFSDAKIQCGEGKSLKLSDVKFKMTDLIESHHGLIQVNRPFVHDWFSKGAVPSDRGWAYYPLLKADHYDSLDSDGLKFLRKPAAPFVKKGMKVFTDAQEIELGCYYWTTSKSVFYTTDGTEPTRNSLRYSGPIKIDRSIVIKAATIIEENTSPIMTAEFTQQADRKNWKTTLQNQPNPQYTGRGDRGLIDGLRGGADFRSGGWQGFDGKELELVLDMGEAKEVSKIGIGFLQDDNSWVFIPQMVFFETSLDGKNWQAASTVLAKRATTGPGEGFLEDFETTLSAKKLVRFVRIKTQSHLTCPAWHKGTGSAAWIFADEIWVE